MAFSFRFYMLKVDGMHFCHLIIVARTPHSIARSLGK